MAPAPVLRSDLVVNGLFVPAGRHLVELRYWPVGFSAGLLAFAATLAGFIVLLAVDRRPTNTGEKVTNRVTAAGRATPSY